MAKKIGKTFQGVNGETYVMPDYKITSGSAIPVEFQDETIAQEKINKSVKPLVVTDQDRAAFNRIFS